MGRAARQHPDVRLLPGALTRRIFGRHRRSGLRHVPPCGRFAPGHGQIGGVDRAGHRSRVQPRCPAGVVLPDAVYRCGVAAPRGGTGVGPCAALRGAGVFVTPRQRCGSYAGGGRFLPAAHIQLRGQRIGGPIAAVDCTPCPPRRRATPGHGACRSGGRHRHHAHRDGAAHYSQRAGPGVRYERFTVHSPLSCGFWDDARWLFAEPAHQWRKAAFVAGHGLGGCGALDGVCRSGAHAARLQGSPCHDARHVPAAARMSASEAWLWIWARMASVVTSSSKTPVRPA